MVVMLGGPQICPILEAKALAYEKAWHLSPIVLKMNPIFVDPAVLLAIGLFSSSEHLI